MDSLTSLYQFKNMILEENADAAVGDEAENDLGCSLIYYRSSSAYNLCAGSPCYYSSHCSTDCCSSYAGYCQYSSWCDDGVNLAWLWWMLASICLVLCIVSMIVGAKRRRRQMELAQQLHQSHQAQQRHQQQDGTTTTTVYYAQPG